MRFIEFTRLSNMTSVILNIDDISSVVMYDRYRPNYGSVIRLKGGTTFHVTASVEGVKAIMKKVLEDE